ncbi:sigma-70 family RNA polymerase sigma factor [bacterium]|nr:sigma-70 family RNA polymerase sigma factor [bacterium]
MIPHIATRRPPRAGPVRTWSHAMIHRDDPSITALLRALDSGERDADHEQAAFEAVYPHLHAMAANLMRSERATHTLQPTALVSEAYLRLVDQSAVSWRSRTHFFAIASRIMRRVLVDHARNRSRQKRGGAYERVTLRDVLAVEGDHEDRLIDVIAFDQALARLEAEHERIARVVELRVFGGLTVPEVAAILDVSERTVGGDWTFACMWIARVIARDGEDRADG